MTKIVDIEDIRKKREKKEIGIPIENINKKELKRRGHEIGDILGCDEKGEEICVRKGKGNLYVDGDMEKEQLFDFMRSQISDLSEHTKRRFHGDRRSRKQDI